MHRRPILGRLAATHSLLSIACLASVSAGCLLSLAPAQDSAKSQSKAHPVFKNGQAQVVQAFRRPADWITHQLWVQTEFDSDGDGKPDRMHVDVTRPGQTETEGLKVAVIYETSPYYSGVSGGGSEFFWDPKHELGSEPPERPHPPAIAHQGSRKHLSRSPALRRTWVPRGFAVVNSSSPGTGMSEGCPTVGGKNEALAPKAIIDWLNGRALGFTTVDGDELVAADWATGKVGMTGTSYNGTLPIAAATTGVKGLEAIIPVSPNTSYYHYYRSNGLVRHPGGYMGEDVDVLYDFIHSGPMKVREYCNCNVRDKLMAESQDRVSGDYNDFWASRDYLNQLDSYHAATLIAHGFNDWNVMPAHSTRVYAALKAKGVPAQAYFHQGAHGGNPPLALMNRWFSHYLYGVKNGVEKDPRAWIVREGDRRNKPTSYADYPNSGASPVTLHLQKGGRKQGKLTLETKKKQGIETLSDDASISGKDLAKAEESTHRLLYTTPILSQDLHLSGTAKLTVRLAADKPAANLSVWLVSLPWERSRNIYDNLITRGWADPQNHKSIRESEALVPGKFYELSFDLQPDDQVIPAGQRIGLMIFSSDKDFTLWPAAGTKLSIDLDTSSLQLPIVGGKAAFRRATRK